MTPRISRCIRGYSGLAGKGERSGRRAAAIEEGREAKNTNWEANVGMKAKTNKHPSTGRETTAAKQAGPTDWWEPQLDTPIGRIELVIINPDHVQVRRAGWMETFERLIPHDIGINLTRTADGHWQPNETYKARRHREIAWAVSEAVTAWMAVEPAEKDDLLRRATALDNGLTPLWTGPVMALAKCADRLSSEVERGLFDCNDAGQVRNVAMQTVEHLRKMMVDVVAMRGELWQAIAPPTETKVAA
jgi:hypothetical protein